MPQALLSLLKITVASRGIFWFQTKFRTVFFFFYEKCQLYFDIDYIGLVDHLNILTILVLPIHEQKIAFHLFVSYSISVISVLNSQCADFSPSCLKLFPSIIYYFWCYCNGIFLLISFSDRPLLM